MVFKVIFPGPFLGHLGIGCLGLMGLLDPLLMALLGCMEV
jgi:hypothetical protein